MWNKSDGSPLDFESWEVKLDLYLISLGKTHLDFVFSALWKAPLHDLVATDANSSLSTDSTDFQFQLGTTGTPDNPETPCWAPYLGQALITMENKAEHLQTGLLFMNKLLLYPWNDI